MLMLVVLLATGARLAVATSIDQFGTAYQVRDIIAGSGNANPDELLAVDGRLLFKANDCADCVNIELWRSDGTAAGTVNVADLAGNANPAFLTAVGGKAFFAAYSPAVGTELWMSNGSSVTLVRDIYPGSYWSSPRGLTDVDGTLYFTANDGSHGRELWKTDGTTAGTVMVKDITPGSASTVFAVLPGYPNFAAVGNRLFFVADDGVTGHELWVSDGTANGTRMVKDINPGPGSSMTESNRLVSPAPTFNMIAFGGKLLFAADDGSSGSELWVSDGTTQGTYRLKDIEPGAGPSTPDDMAVSGLLVYFTASTSASGNEVWSTNGTPQGTVEAADINPGSGSSFPSFLTDVGGTLFFQADDGSSGAELWKIDGAQSGATQLADIMPGAGSSYPGKPVGAGGVAFFSADDGTHGEELWASDGTPAGTMRLTDINPGSASAGIGNRLAAVDDIVYFTADDGSTGGELWAIKGPNALIVNSVGDGADNSPGDGKCDTGGVVGNDAECTLRAAIGESNAGPRHTIRFDIPIDQSTGGVYLIEPATSLPQISKPATIDASTQFGFLPGAPVVELKGPGVETDTWGFQAMAGDTIIRGFSIYGFGINGILLENAGYNHVEGNIIGSNAQNIAAPGNGEDGIVVRNSEHNVIGGGGALDLNVISRNGQAGTGGCGIQLSGGTQTQISGNFVGTDTSGTQGNGNGSGGICLLDSASNRIGGKVAGESNVISGNGGDGVRIQGTPSSGNEILANVVGLDFLAGTALANTHHGVLIDAAGSGNVVGDKDPPGSNIISGNGMDGVLIRGGNGGNSVDGNFIGTDGQGTAALANGEGLAIVDAPNNNVGSALPNVISGNGGHGVRVSGNLAVANLFADNLIGVAFGGIAALPNTLDGVRIAGARGTVVSGNVVAANGGYGIAILGDDGSGSVNAAQADAMNVIVANGIGAAMNGAPMGNGSDGVRIDDSSRNTIGAGNWILGNGGTGITVIHKTYGDGNVITGNDVSGNAALGIDLGGDSVTPNDASDSDTGANGLQNYPMIGNIVGAPLNLVEGTLDSAANRGYTIETFINAVADPSGNGEGETFSNTWTAMTDGSGQAAFTAGFGAGQPGECVSITARDNVSGDTSEFSPCVTIPPPYAINVDFGDAPDDSGSYPTLLASGGARHLIDPGIHMGSLVDADADGQPNADATGDDSDGSDDDDGVTFIDPLAQGSAGAQVQVSVSATGKLDAWIDFNRDGDWNDASEQVFASVPLGAGVHTLAIVVPNDAVPGTTFARFRFSTAGGLAPYGPAMDGEVEDYAVQIVEVPIFADGFELPP